MRILGWIAAAGALAAAACNVSQEGDQGTVIFTPDECGRLGGCDFADSIGTGGVIQVWIRGAEGVSTAGFDLISGTPGILDVAAIPDGVAGRPTWEVVALAPGVGQLVAVDSQGLEVDTLEVGVQDVTALRLENFLGDAVGPTSDATYDEIWRVNAFAQTSFYTTPLIGAGVPTMGVFQYDVVVDQGLEAGLLETSEVAEGFFDFNVPPGDYVINITSDSGVPLDVLIQAIEATP